MATKLMGLSLDELSFVDRPANKAARVSIFKRDNSCDDYISVEKGDLPDEVHEYLKREFSTAQRESAAEAGQAMPGGGYPIKNTQDLKNAVRAIGRAKNPAATRRHIARRAQALGATEQLPGDWTKSLNGDNMDKHQEAMDAIKAEIAKLTARLDGIGKEDGNGTSSNPKATNGSGEGSSTTPAAPAAAPGPSAEATAAAEKRFTEAVEAEVKKRMEAAASDEIIKVVDPADATKTIDLKKSEVGAGQFAFLKAQNEEIKKAKDAQQLVELTKQAETDYGNLPGKPAEKADVLKAMLAMKEDVRKTLEGMLKSGNAGIKKSMSPLGQDGGGSADDPAIKLDSMATEYAKANKVSKAKAYDEVLKTTEGAALYRDSLGTPKAA